MNIPAGINEGQAISVRGQGNAGKNGGPSGDLIVGIRITAQPHLPAGRDVRVLYEQTVSFYQAAMGAELEIPTIDGKVKWSLPAGTQPGTTFRLKGKGIPTLQGRGRGDQYVTVKVKVPTEPECRAEGGPAGLRRGHGRGRGCGRGGVRSEGLFRQAHKKEINRHGKRRVLPENGRARRFFAH